MNEFSEHRCCGLGIVVVWDKGGRVRTGDGLVFLRDPRYAYNYGDETVAGMLQEGRGVSYRRKIIQRVSRDVGDFGCTWGSDVTNNVPSLRRLSLRWPVTHGGGSWISIDGKLCRLYFGGLSLGFRCSLTSVPLSGDMERKLEKKPVVEAASRSSLGTDRFSASVSTKSFVEQHQRQDKNPIVKAGEGRWAVGQRKGGHKTAINTSER